MISFIESDSKVQFAEPLIIEFTMTYGEIFRAHYADRNVSKLDAKDDDLLLDPTRIDLRVSIHRPDSSIAVYFREKDELGDPRWTHLEDGLSVASSRAVNRFVTLFRRIVIVEMLQRMSLRGEFLTASTGAHLVKL
jgi:hypothetical protein